MSKTFKSSDLQTNSDGDNINVVHTDIFAADHQVYVAFKVASNEHEDDGDFATNTNVPMQYAKYDSETESLNFADDFDHQNSQNPVAIKSQLASFLKTPEAQEELQTAIDVIIERKRVQEIADNLEEGEAVIANLDVTVKGFTLTTNTSFAVKEYGFANEIISFSAVDLETGKPSYTDNIEELYVSPELHEKLNTLLYDYFESTPISEDILNFYRADADNQAYLAAEFARNQTAKDSNIAITEINIAVNSEKDAIAIFDIIERNIMEEGNQDYRYIEHESLSETLDIDKQSVVHKSQSSLDYHAYDHDEVRSALSQHIKDQDILSDKVVAEIRSLLTDKSEEKDDDRVRQVAH